MANKPTGNPNGRPTKYDAKIHPEIVKKLASRGLTEEEMSNVLDISRPTFHAWKEAHPEFLDAVTDGKANPIKDVEDALFRLCKGYVYKEDGHDKIKHPDVRAIQFYLKNVAGDKWKDKHDVNASGDITLTVVYDEPEDPSS